MLLAEFARRLDAADFRTLKLDVLVRLRAIALAAAQAATPVRSGTLLASEYGDVVGTGEYLVLGSDVEYAPYVEYGTGRMAGRYMLQAGVDAAEAALDAVWTASADRWMAALLAA